MYDTESESGRTGRQENRTKLWMNGFDDEEVQEEQEEKESCSFFRWETFTE